jgi:hypothetical protein
MQNLINILIVLALLFSAISNFYITKRINTLKERMDLQSELLLLISKKLPTKNK